MSDSARFRITGYMHRNTYTGIRILEPMIDEYLLGRGLVDDPLSLSKETRCRDGVSRSTALSDTLWGIGWVARNTGGDGKRISDVEGSSEPPKAPLFIRRLAAERPTGDDPKSEGRADSLSELVC